MYIFVYGHMLMPIISITSTAPEEDASSIDPGIHARMAQSNADVLVAAVQRGHVLPQEKPLLQ